MQLKPDERVSADPIRLERKARGSVLSARLFVKLVPQAHETCLSGEEIVDIIARIPRLRQLGPIESTRDESVWASTHEIATSLSEARDGDGYVEPQEGED